MKHITGYSRPTALLGGVLLGLSALNAVAQAPGRRNVPFRSASANGQTSAPASSSVFGTYPQSRNAATALNAAGSVGAANTPPSQQGAGGPGQGQGQGQTPDIVTVQYTTSSELVVQWSGNAQGVNQVSLGLFDANGKALERKDFTQLPVQARFTLTEAASHYGVQIKYASGKTTTVYQPLQ